MSPLVLNDWRDSGEKDTSRPPLCCGTLFAPSVLLLLLPHKGESQFSVLVSLPYSFTKLHFTVHLSFWICLYSSRY